MQLREAEHRHAIEVEALMLQKKQKKLAEAHETIANIEQELRDGMRLCDAILEKPTQPTCKTEPSSPAVPVQAGDTQVNGSSPEALGSPWSQDAQPMFDDVRRELFASPTKADDKTDTAADSKPDEQIEAEKLTNEQQGTSTEENLPLEKQNEAHAPDSKEPTDKQAPGSNQPTEKQAPDNNPPGPPTGKQCEDEGTSSMQPTAQQHTELALVQDASSKCAQAANEENKPQHTAAAVQGKSPAATPTLTKAEAPALAIVAVPALPKSHHAGIQQQTAAKSLGPPPGNTQLQAPNVAMPAHGKSAAATPTLTKAKALAQVPPPPAPVIQKRLARIMEPNAKGVFKVSESIRQQWHHGDKQGIFKLFASVGYNPDRVHVGCYMQ